MNASNASAFSLRHRLVAALVLAHLLAVLALAASPKLHHWVHPDEGDDDHDCAVVLFVHGGCESAALPAVLSAFIGTWVFVLPTVLEQTWVASVFAASHVFEHAPPRLAACSCPLIS